MKYKSVLTATRVLLAYGLLLVIAGCNRGATVQPDRLIPDKYAPGPFSGGARRTC